MRHQPRFESPRERQCNQILNPRPSVSVQQLSNKRLWTGMDGMQIGQHGRSVWPYRSWRHSLASAEIPTQYIFGAFSYSQTSWLLTRGGSESLGESRLPPSIPKRRAFDGPDGGTG